MKKLKLSYLLLLTLLVFGCNPPKTEQQVEDISEEDSGFKYVTDRFADLQVIRYKVPDFDRLTLSQKKLVD